MTKEEARQAAKVMLAWADGKEVVFRRKGNCIWGIEDKNLVFFFFFFFFFGTGKILTIASNPNRPTTRNFSTPANCATFGAKTASATSRKIGPARTENTTRRTDQLKQQL